MSEALERITTWNELVEHVRTTYTVAANSEQNDLIVEAAGSTIRLRQVDVYGAAWVEIVATLVKMLRHAPPVPILTRNFLIPIGILALRDGSLLLRQLLPIDGLRPTDLAEVIELMTDTIIEGKAKEEA